MGNFYRTYTFTDLLTLYHLREQLSKSEQMYIPDQTMLSFYTGHTFFSIFAYNSQVYDTVLLQLNKRNIEESRGSETNQTKTLFSRQLYKILCMPVYENELILKDRICTSMPSQWCCYSYKSGRGCFSRVLFNETDGYCDCRSYVSLLRKSIFYKNSEFRDRLL